MAAEDPEDLAASVGGFISQHRTNDMRLSGSRMCTNGRRGGKLMFHACPPQLGIVGMRLE